jgi:hypothetical protein
MSAPPSTNESVTPADAAPATRGKHRARKRLFWVLLLIAAFGYFYVLDGWRDLTDGRLHRKAQDLFSYFESDGVTEVRIYLLQGTPGKATSESFPGGDGDAAIYGSITLTGEELESFLSIWHYQMINHATYGLCHDPAYGFRFYKGTRLFGETSVCWACKNFSVRVWPFQDPQLYGFDASGKAGQDLLNFCDSRQPYYRRPKPARSNPPEPKASTSTTPPTPELWPY